MKISPLQVKNVYTGLKIGEQYRTKYFNCLEASVKLDSIIQDSHNKTLLFTSKLSERDSIYYRLNFDYIKKISENELLKAKKIPWYLHPLFYLPAGFIAGAALWPK